MDGLIALIAFSFVSAVTPGPNNVLLWASGTEFGFRRTLRHVVGTAIGIGALALAAAAGLAALVTGAPELGLVMKIGGSIYLLWLAYRIARAGALARPDVAQPLGIREAAAFQVVNPKAWVFALGAMTTFRLVGVPGDLGGPAAAGVMALVVLPSAAIWAAAGGSIGRLVSSERARRIVSLILGGVLVVTVVLAWV